MNLTTTKRKKSRHLFDKNSLKWLWYDIITKSTIFQCPESSVQIPVQSPASSVQCPESSVQSPASNSCVQSPGIPVCHETLSLKTLTKNVTKLVAIYLITLASSLTYFGWKDLWNRKHSIIFLFYYIKLNH